MRLKSEHVRGMLTYQGLERFDYFVPPDDVLATARVVITGASGFIGSAVTRAVYAGHSIPRHPPGGQGEQPSRWPQRTYSACVGR
jgi:hypothetical protein